MSHLPHTRLPWTVEINASHPTGRITSGDIVVAYATSQSDTRFIAWAANHAERLRTALSDIAAETVAAEPDDQIIASIQGICRTALVATKAGAS